MAKGKNVVEILNRKIKTEKALIILLYAIAIITSLTLYTINKALSNKEKQKGSGNDTDYIIDIIDNTVIYQDNFDFNLRINNFESKNNYKIVIDLNNNNVIEQEILDKQNKFHLKLNEEGKYEVSISIFKENEINFNKILNIYYVKPYVNQFLDELSNRGVVTHYRNTISNYADSRTYKQSLISIKNCGFKNINGGVLWYQVDDGNGKFDFLNYKKWIQEAQNLGIHVSLKISDTHGENYGGDNAKIDNSIELKHFKQFFSQILNLKREFSNITYCEMINEPNLNTPYHGVYLTNEDMLWYSKMVETITDNEEYKNNIVIGEVANVIEDTEDRIAAKKFFDTISKNLACKTITKYSCHIYDSTNGYTQDRKFSLSIQNYKEQFNNLGGFIETYVTEYGLANHTGNKMTENEQADRLVQETVLLDKYNVGYACIYNFYNVGIDSSNKEHNFGLVRNDYTPKMSYYTMKNLLTNINGAEYIGNISLKNGIEMHVYDKNGIPLAVVWSDDSNKKYEIQNENFIVKDAYGKNAETDEKLTITQSPLYISNLNKNYFYQAISNVTTTKYDEFTEKFSSEISQIENLQTLIATLKEQMQNIKNISELDETTATDLMKLHYMLGTTILESYKTGTIQIEDKKVSSMLDFLDDIGDTFEDLVTVSSTTRNANLNLTETKIKETESLINKYNTEFEIIYPEKILQFSKDFYDTASYINGVEEENPIKTGLIVSKNLHSELLANWSNEFAKIYIDKYIQEYITTYPVELVYSTEEPTNQNVVVSLVTQGELENVNMKEFTFEKNGTFMFEYTIKGEKFTKLAQVTNIDKEAPVISGVQNEGLYLNQVQPIIIDKNIETIKLYKDSTLVENYVANTTISEEGTYKIIAEDKAKNKTEVEFYISHEPVKIKYSSTEITNKSVEATLVSNFEFEVINNSKNKTYVFEENGVFKFECIVKGTVVNVTATVSNIDKTLPEITNIENNTVYQEAVRPIVKDENLNYVELYKDSNREENYIQNTTISEDGTYKIIAIDKAGNKSEAEFDIYKIPATIKYSETELTNQDIIATINSKANIQILNNNQNKEYTFKENGKFNFEYKIRNQEFTIEAVVNNIDKEAPKITEVEENKVYINEITPNVQEINLDKIILYKNEEEVKNYKIGNKIAGEGIYKLVAIDKAKNETTVNFSIIEDEEKLYKIEDKYIVNVSGFTTREEFSKKMKTDTQFNINNITRNGVEIPNNTNIATGDILKTNDGQEYTIIVKGDLNKDGKINIVDVIKLRNYLLTSKGFDNTELKAADCNLDGKSISISDLIRLRIMILSNSMN